MEEIPLTQSPSHTQINNNNNDPESGKNVDEIKNASAAWDYVIMFGNITVPDDGKGNQLPEDDPRVQKFRTIQERRRQLVEERLKAPTVGLKVSQRRSTDDKAVFILVTTTEERLETEAERIHLNMKIKNNKGGGYGDFEIANKEMFEPTTDEGLFLRVQRIRLIESILESDTEQGGAGLNLNALVRDGIITKIFPLHQEEKRKWLMSEWVKVTPFQLFFKAQPLDRIRDYFGEDIALYFAWLGFYTKWLWLASIAGVFCFIFWIIGQRKAPQKPEDADDTKFLWTTWFSIIYSIFLAFWATFYLEYWKRRNNELNYMWGTEEYLEQERERPDFIGEESTGVYSNGIWITFEPDEDYGLGAIPKQKYYPAVKRRAKVTGSIPLLIFMLGVVIFVTVCILSFRVFLQSKLGGSQAAKYGGGFLGASVNAMIIIFMNQVWKFIAIKLTTWENHRTDSDFENALISKIFIFYFVNSYTSLFYIGFFKKTASYWNDDDLQDGCKTGTGWRVLGYGCAEELTVQLVTILGVNMGFGQFREVMMPWLIGKLQLYLLKKSVGQEAVKEVPQWERESKKPLFPGTFDEYSEMVIQYGYITMFAAAFPLAPLMAVLNNVVEIRTDAFKLLDAYTRPEYKGAESIGAWFPILEILGIVAVGTNCMLIGFQFSALSDLLDYNTFQTFAAVVILEHVVLVLKWLISTLVPDYPGWIVKAKAKQQFVQEQQLKKLKSQKLKDWHMN